jgi:kinesin family protein C2/C3
LCRYDERSSRSHSIVVVHVEGESFESGSKTRGILYLVDLAGSERVARSEATGDRLKVGGCTS